ncbi:transaldolase [Nitrosomonas marina]|uniref:Transaldolase n=1 Tax=Nitrosomonas marina TaxID=917 RepID=A0A1H8J0X7_9PROT|nr:transaldolase [Nitrosomonas marina]SEN73628.1 transaldolase [Nitrosomonas marina]
MKTTSPLQKLKTLGQSVWLDYIQRGILDNGEVARMIISDGLAGITSNPAIFEKAIIEHDDYDQAVTLLARNGTSASEIYEILAIEDVQRAADLFRPVYEESNGQDGFVSLEVSPYLAYNTESTVAEAKRLWIKLDRPNVMIKVPATRDGLPAITQLITAGINVNVTLLFGITRYQEVANAFIGGLQKRASQHKPIEHIASVASFFLSRIDTLVDKQLDKLAENESVNITHPLRGQAAVASARLAYQHYRKWTDSEYWQELARKGARPQRLLWASTSAKDPAYSDIKYIEPLIGRETVNTMTLQTLSAYRDHGQPAERIEQELDMAAVIPRQLGELGIDLEVVSKQLEEEGVQEFIDPYHTLLENLEQKRFSLIG